MTVPVRLNLGAGDDRRDGFLSVDLRPEVADIVGSIGDLSDFADGEVDELLALDVLEHVWRDEATAVLAEWHRVLRASGRLTVRVPNLVVLGRQIAQGIEVEHSIVNIYGAHRWGPGGAYDSHHYGYTPATLRAALTRAGFNVLDNDERANMTVVCERA